MMMAWENVFAHGGYWQVDGWLTFDSDDHARKMARGKFARQAIQTASGRGLVI